MKNGCFAGRLPHILLPLLLALMLALSVGGGARPVQAVSPGLVISQVYGAGGNTNAVYKNDYVVLFNRSPTTAISVNGLSVQYTSAGGSGNFSGSISVLPDVSLAPGQYFLLKLAGGATGADLPAEDASGAINLSGTDGKVVLVTGTAGLVCNGSSTLCTTEQMARIIDLVGYGSANFYEGTGPAPAASASKAIFRTGGGCYDTDNNAANFDAAAPSPLNSASTANVCYTDSAPFVSETSPAPGTFGVALDASITITFNEPVDVNTGWFSIICEYSGEHGAVVSGGPLTFTLDPDGTFAGGDQCTVTVLAGSVTDQDVDDPPNNMLADFTWNFFAYTPPVMIHNIQGAGHFSPLNGSFVTTTPALVTAIKNNGFYLQESPADEDSDPATSEALFVYTSSAPTVAVGDLVEVGGIVNEFRPTDLVGINNLTTTEIVSPTVNILSSGNSLPEPVVLGVGGRIPPNRVIEDDVSGSVEDSGTFDPASDGIDFYESLEGMLVQVNDAVVVGPTDNNEIPVIGDNGAGAGLRSARDGLLITADDFNPERIILGDIFTGSMPLANTGDTIPGALTGVMDYNFGNYKLLLAQKPSITSGGLIREIAAEPGFSELAVATFNVENLNPGDPDKKFSDLAHLIVDNLKAPDLLALEEVQDDNGATNDTNVSAALTYNKLIDAIQSVGGPVYQVRQIDPVDDKDGGEPGGNIRVAFLFRIDRGLSFVDAPGGTALTKNEVLSSASGAHLKYSPGRIDPTNMAFSFSRKPLAGEFLYKGKKLFVIANHFNSKSGDEPMFGRFQPPDLTSESQRIMQAQVVHDFAMSILAAEPRANIIVLGDMNDFTFSKPLAALVGKSPILHDLVLSLPLAEQYSYVYQGNSEALDHILVSDELYHRSVYDSVHVNAEFADQVSDHDPQLLIIRLPFNTFLPSVRRP